MKSVPSSSSVPRQRPVKPTRCQEEARALHGVGEAAEAAEEVVERGAAGVGVATTVQPGKERQPPPQRKQKNLIVPRPEKSANGPLNLTGVSVLAGEDKQFQ